MDEKPPDKNALMEKAYQFAYEFEQKYGCCPQCVLAAIQETVGGVSDDVFKASQGLAGGTGLAGDGTCGALAGGILAIGAWFGRERRDVEKGLPRESFNYSKMLYDEFVREFGSHTCKGTQIARFGRFFDMWDPEDRDQFFAQGGHVDKCPYVAGKVALWTVEILLEASDTPSFD